jgi:hypothetical protein
MDASRPMIVDLAGVERLVLNYEVFPCLILHPQNLSISKEDFIVYFTLGNTFGTWAYLINRKAAAIALQNNGLVDSTADWPYSWRQKVFFARPEKSQFSVRLEGSLVEEVRTNEIDKMRRKSPLTSRHKFVNRIQTLLGLVGILSFLARVRGVRFRQHYLEEILIPFLVRRIHGND